MYNLSSFVKQRCSPLKLNYTSRMLLSVLLFSLVSVQANSALMTKITDEGRVTRSSVGIFEFSVDSPSSHVNIWERSSRDFRITLFDGLGDFIATNDDHGWGANAGGHHARQNWLDASLALTLLEDNYTAVVSYWTNSTGNQIDDFGHNWRGGNYKLIVRGRGISEGHNSVPEPGSLALMALGLLGLGAMKKRKARA